MANKIITVAFFKNANDTVCGFEVQNHSRGIVCAAVSFLTQNTINSIECFVPDVGITYEVATKTGYISFHFLDKDACETDEKACLLMDSFLLGMHSLQEEYPKNIRIVGL